MIDNKPLTAANPIAIKHRGSRNHRNSIKISKEEERMSANISSHLNIEENVVVNYFGSKRASQQLLEESNIVVQGKSALSFDNTPKKTDASFLQSPQSDGNSSMAVVKEIKRFSTQS